MELLTRTIRKDIDSALKRQAAVALLGPRQIGKTTLALAVGQDYNALYLDLEDSNDRAKLSNPALFFEHEKDRLVILDEIHRMPELFSDLRGIIDKGRREGKGKGRFLILGSASIELLKQSSETLAGRIAYIQMSPLSVTELGVENIQRDILWLRGGFPDSYLSDNDADSLMWRKDFIRTYLERDIPMFGPRIPASTMERLWTMLAHRQGSILNASDLAKALDISAQSVTRYIDLLGDLLLVRRLPAFHGNVGKRLVKSPKIYIRDSGLTHALLGLEQYNQLAGHPVVGVSWEGFVVENIHSVLPWRAETSYYRTSSGTEVDLVIDHTNGERWVVEIKRALSAKLSKGFYASCETLQPHKSFVVTAADDGYPISESVRAVSVAQMLRLLVEAGAQLPEQKI